MKTVRNLLEEFCIYAIEYTSIYPKILLRIEMRGKYGVNTKFYS